MKFVILTVLCKNLFEVSSLKPLGQFESNMACLIIRYFLVCGGFSYTASWYVHSYVTQESGVLKAHVTQDSAVFRVQLSRIMVGSVSQNSDVFGVQFHKIMVYSGFSLHRNLVWSRFSHTGLCYPVKCDTGAYRVQFLCIHSSITQYPGVFMIQLQSVLVVIYLPRLVWYCWMENSTKIPQ